MGCIKSKTGNSGAPNANSTGKTRGGCRGPREGEKAFLVHPEADAAAESFPQVSPVLLEYAQKLSEEIVARAVQQWVEVDRRYSDIPYIECDMP
ncbi:small membrane A-kinase anchor protein-like [Solea solea]|uniref:small membrane A-kinase anchor protein-like n=1 Tax=Solea solea TaxID=90069 RepID=UPI00272A46DD|nr:small membrane A-kinase anchor protein-like [Solea solea]